MINNNKTKVSYISKYINKLIKEKKRKEKQIKQNNKPWYAPKYFFPSE